MGKYYGSEYFQSYSGGTEVKAQINQDAVRIMKEIYNIDMEETQYSKLISDLPKLDIVITMGCNVNCPYLPCSHREDWGLKDPSGKSDEEFKIVIRKIEEKIKKLIEDIRENKIITL